MDVCRIRKDSYPNMVMGLFLKITLNRKCRIKKKSVWLVTPNAGR